ncbi:UNVERIFIED_CONTAM: Retrovirus-related Pol polyprotein from transposon TNT 1-94 [Sesamum angustifolium]|uniref:Retrovirus-related Pol polyprotein from transposon TNT 1-94 n=1 Tax=Sesamum angustifolium TaxID=2727405 RepID=A0AAW2LEC5_9LAMI
MKFEMGSMGSNQVSTLVDPPKGVKPIGCKWVYKRNLKLTRRILPSRPGSWRKMNVKTAFLNSFVEKVIYMDQLEHFTSVGEEQKKISGNSVTYLMLYVDDILLIGNDVKMLGDTKAWLSTQFFMKDMGEASYILSIKIYRDRSRGMLGMTQSSYIEKVLKRFNMKTQNENSFTERHIIKLSKKRSPKTDEELKSMLDIPNTSAIGNIQYVVQCTRLDVAFALSIMSRYQACAGEAHWSTVKTIIKYQKRITDMFLIYRGTKLILEGYNDASFQSNDDDA